MARSRSGSRTPRDLDDPGKPADPKLAAPDLASAVSSVTPEPEPEPEPEPRAPSAPEPAKVVPLKGPPITLSTFARRHPRDSIMKAFIHCEQLAHAHTRKRTRSEWDAEYSKFLKEPR